VSSGSNHICGVMIESNLKAGNQKVRFLFAFGVFFSFFKSYVSVICLRLLIFSIILDCSWAATRLWPECD
jgi:hypothetical protein